MAHPNIGPSLTFDEKCVASHLISDFEKSGITIPKEVKDWFVKLTDKMLALGQEVINTAQPAVRSIQFKDAYVTLAGVPLKTIESMCKSPRRVGRGELVATVMTGSSDSHSVLELTRGEDSRRKVNLAMNSASERQLAVLEILLLTKGELATLLGGKSDAEMALGDKMVGSPGARVSTFYDVVWVKD